MRSAFERLLRMGELTASEHAAAGVRLERLRRGWRELQPSQLLQSQAETLLVQFPLWAADALQLAAALYGRRVPYRHVPSSAAMRNFWKQLRYLGFETVSAS